MNASTDKPTPKTTPRAAWRLLSGYWRSDDKWMAWGLLLLVPALNGVMVYQSLLQNRINGVMFDALGARHAGVFWRQIALEAAIMAAWVVTYTVNQWIIQRLQMRWRTWMNAHFLGRWLDKKTYYRLDRSGAIDNPDQRLSEDMLILTGDKGLKNAFDFLHQMGIVVVFTGVLWNLSRTIQYQLGGHTVAMPGLVVFVFLLFCLASTGLVEWLGRPLLRARYHQQAREGDYRFALVRVRENSEPIALYAGERAEQRRLDGAFAAIRQNWRHVVRSTFGVNLSSWGSSQAAQVVPWLLGAGAYFAGTLSLGGVTRLFQTCNQMRIGLLWFIQNYPDLADVRAALSRLVEFDRLLDEPENPRDIVVADSQDEVLRTYDLALHCPDGRVLSEPASMDIKAGSTSVIVGPSGCGKSTFLLSLAGLWQHGSGRIEMPSGRRSMFIPQRPYVPIGTLKDALCYPGMADEFGDEACAEALQTCRLGHYAALLGETAHWSKRLSPGEQQRLAFARVLLQRPDTLFLDESTSALDSANEAWLYQQVRERLPACTVISVAHRESVIALHQRKLSFSPPRTGEVLGGGCTTPAAVAVGS
ncbi:ABC transporter ATP-binding protein/permease [Frateuria defendens]|uniref:ABC transporter ATP-binding protein/permease n=1 Tax=Frateuria defendens TaxID=2219559 RepID=UPI00066FD7EB|nr:ABC transporter ATP-binding protein/permease [Frateuria defendens]